MAEFLGSARGRLLAVFDTPEAAADATREIEALGVEPDRIETFTGDDGAAAFDGSGVHHGVLGRLYRVIQFTLVDQAPDFTYYEAAARQGRVVLSVRRGARSRCARPSASSGRGAATSSTGSGCSRPRSSSAGSARSPTCRGSCAAEARVGRGGLGRHAVRFGDHAPRPASRVNRRVPQRHEALRRGREDTPGAVNDLCLTVPAGQDLRPRRAVGLRQDDEPEDGQPAHRADERARSSSTATDVAKRDVIELRRSIGYVIQQVGLFPHQTDRRERRHRAAAARLVERAPAASARDGAAGARRARPGDATATATRRSCRAASASASAWPGRSPPTRRSCSWTSRSAPSTRSSASGSRTSSCASRSELAKTILFVTHDIDEAIKMGDLVAVMQVGGHLAQFGAAGRDPRQPGVRLRRPLRRRGPRPEAPRR